MRYYNYLTTPSGKKCKLNEITNRDYLILLKFLNGDNYEGFYDKLNSLISETIPDFEDFNIADKAYVYIAFYFYSIKASIGVKAENPFNFYGIIPNSKTTVDKMLTAYQHLLNNLLSGNLKF